MSAMRKPRAGRFRNKITVQVNTDTRDAFGGVANSWGTLIILWAQVLRGGGGETLSGDQVTSNQPSVFTCRVDPSNPVLPEHRISWNGKLYDIQSVDDAFDLGQIQRITAIERGIT